MAKEKKKFWPVAVVLLFIAYFLIAARPINRENVLKALWLSPLDSGTPVSESASGTESESSHNRNTADTPDSIPFSFNDHYGYIDSSGHFLINRIKQGLLSMSDSKWSEYEAEPSALEIRNKLGDITETIDDPRGYPVFLDGQTYIISGDSNAFTKTGNTGNKLWTYEFSTPVICADSAAGMLLTGSLDGVVEVLDADGKQIFSFEPGGSRLPIILGCAFSHDGRRFAIVSGIDKQRFLLFERLAGSGFGNTNGEFKIIYHEFLGEGFRRPVHVSFIDSDRRVVFEREGGLGVYDINSRREYTVALDGELAAIDDSGGEGQLFVIVSNPLSETKRLIGINLPGKIFMNAPFKSPGVFLRRDGSRLFIGGGSTLASFELEKK